MHRKRIWHPEHPEESVFGIVPKERIMFVASRIKTSNQKLWKLSSLWKIWRSWIWRFSLYKVIKIDTKYTLKYICLLYKTFLRHVYAFFHWFAPPIISCNLDVKLSRPRITTWLALVEMREMVGNHDLLEQRQVFIFSTTHFLRNFFLGSSSYDCHCFIDCWSCASNFRILSKKVWQV